MLELDDPYSAVRKIGDTPTGTAQSGEGSVGRAESLRYVLCRGLPRKRSSTRDGVVMRPRCVVDQFPKGSMLRPKVRMRVDRSPARAHSNSGPLCRPISPGVCGGGHCRNVFAWYV